jgi:hypothetical protein
MAKKYILFDDAIIAQERCHAARERMNPNRRALQLAAHEENPAMYPHPDSEVLGWDSDRIHDWVEAPNGQCEIELDDSEVQHYPDDLDNIRATPALEHAQGPKEG